jgi:hypothetical protein
MNPTPKTPTQSRPSGLLTVRTAHGRQSGAYRRAACYLLTPDGARLLAGDYVTLTADRPPRRLRAGREAL